MPGFLDLAWSIVAAFDRPYSFWPGAAPAAPWADDTW